MMQTGSETHGKWARLRSPNFLVLFIGTLFVDAWYIAASIFFMIATGSLPFFVYFWLIPMIGLSIAAIVTWYRPKIGYAVYTVLGALALILFSDGGHGVEIYATPSNTAEFFDTITTIPTYLAILIYSILGLRDTIRPPSPQAVARQKTISRSSVMAILIVGFIIGGLIVGLMAGATEARLIAGAGSQADIVVVQNASGLTTTAYSPGNYTVKVGATVTWVNRDNTAHTVTTKPGAPQAFDSLEIPPGGLFKHTFNTAGTYEYYCTLHPNMIGYVIVQP